MRVLLPICLDRWRNPIATLLRACVEANPDIEFHSVSSPFSEEDARLAKAFWALPNVRAAGQMKLTATRFDGVHTASITPHNLAAAVASKVRSVGACRFLTTINLEVGPGDGKDWTLLQVAERLADAFVSVSRAAGQGVAERCAGRYHGVIPNGFDAAYFDPAIEDDAILSAEVRDLGPFALYVGALEPRKHPEFVVELARAHPGIPFVGAGYVHPLGRHFEPMVKSVPNLRWLGHVDRRMIRALLRRAAVFLFPSEREGLALSVIEALGMGVPVIAQPKSSMPELIRDGVNGRLIDIREPAAWSDALQSFIRSSGASRATTAAAIRADALECYSWESIGRQYGDLYRRLFR
ncbi:glycosyltransferase family 4 protein [Luteolibacter ambystomatis]|uniref:Glycosyltransferase family 4 protein n=1 Tax=Luteolibacter ambystomatis TaxID=2824561 RepID=A0A975G7K0_9BACT|nr:glycosyltransferase family 4 protein [Luteolibacter ambystomatis]QUE50226.1 glycosyltransferase family 4 protein [Luteolibacter ambystomatis]